MQELYSRIITGQKAVLLRGLVGLSSVIMYVLNDRSLTRVVHGQRVPTPLTPPPKLSACHIISPPKAGRMLQLSALLASLVRWLEPSTAQ